MPDLSGAQSAQPVSIFDETSGNQLSIDSSGRITNNIAQWLGSTAPTVGTKTAADCIPVVLASDQVINVSANIDTAVTNGRVYVTVVQNYSLGSANTERMVLYVRNPAASGRTLYLKQVFVNTRQKTNSTLARIYANPTVTVNGTANAITNTSIGSVNTSVAIATTTPTVTSNGTIVHIYATGGNQNDHQITTFADALPANNSYLITAEGSQNNTNVDFTLLWTEE